MKDRKPILMTGHRGYLGAVMAPYLVERGYDVVGLDIGYFDDCTLIPDPIEIPQIRKDLRDLVAEDLSSFYAVIHLAALSNDPIGNLEESWTDDINFRATLRLAELAKDAEVRRFLFSSSCIMYGLSESGTVDERSPVDPQTLYASSKVRAESALRGLASDRFSPTLLRNGTVYGLSPRMRFDTVLNDLTAGAFTSGKVTIYSDGQPWRPVLHVEDVARTFRRVLEAPLDDVHDQVFNNGANHLNYQVIELARFVAQAVEGCELEVLNQPSADQRTYQADFSKFARTFPDFQFRWSAERGAAQLAEDFRRIGLTREQYEGNRFVRLRWLEYLLESGRLDKDLRWREDD